MVTRPRPRLGSSLLSILLLTCVVVATVAGVATGAFLDPRFEATAPEPVLEPGTTQEVTVLLVNDARDPEDTVRPARDLRIEVGSTGPIEALSGPRFVDRLGDGERIPVTVRVRVPADAAAGTYDLPLRVDYVVDEREETARPRVAVRIDERARLRVVGSDVQVTAGDDGRATVTVENVGSATARNARLELTSTSLDLTLGGGAVAARALETLGPGERRVVDFRVESRTRVTDQSYALEATVTYENTDRVVVSEAVGTVSVVPTPGPSFVVRDLTSTLRVGEEGTVSGRVVNVGGAPARDAVVVVETSARGISLRESVLPLGTLTAGAGADFSLPATVAVGADPGARPVSVTVDYLTDDGDVRAGDPARATVVVSPERNRFRVTPVEAAVDVDDSGRFTVEVTNVGDDPLTDVDARITPSPPLTSAAPESFTPRIDPGETVRFTFHVESADDAVATTVAVRLNLSAETGDGRTVRQSELVPVDIVEPTGPETETSVFAAGAVVVLLAFVTGWWWLRQ